MANPKFKALSIQVGLNGLSFCILDHKSGSVSFFKRMTFETKGTPSDTLNALKEVLSSHTAFAEDFDSVLVIHQNELSTLVPKALYGEAHNADYLKFNSKILRTDFITYDNLESLDMVNVYIPYVNINNYIFDTFGEFTYKHASSILIETLLHKNISDSDCMFLNIDGEILEVLVANRKNVKLFNRFEFTTTDDFLYYTLFVVEQLQLDRETIRVKVLGNIKEDDDNFKAVYNYIRHVSILETKSSFDLRPIDAAESLPNNFVILNSF